VNRQLNHAALNAGRWTSEKKRWKWDSEVAVVTGGCSGIGELTVRRLVGRGIKVAVLDIQQLPPSLQGCKPNFPMTPSTSVRNTDQVLNQTPTSSSSPATSPPHLLCTRRPRKSSKPSAPPPS
jgi:hypothetical protein